MFANDRASSTATRAVTLNIVGSGTSAHYALADYQRGQRAEAGSAGELRPTRKQSINLRPGNDEPALEYGCVDWFLYE